MTTCKWCDAPIEQCFERKTGWKHKHRWTPKNMDFRCGGKAEPSPTEGTQLDGGCLLHGVPEGYGCSVCLNAESAEPTPTEGPMEGIKVLREKYKNKPWPPEGTPEPATPQTTQLPPLPMPHVTPEDIKEGKRRTDQISDAEGFDCREQLAEFRSQAVYFQRQLAALQVSHDRLLQAGKEAYVVMTGEGGSNHPFDAERWSKAVTGLDAQLAAAEKLTGRKG